MMNLGLIAGGGTTIGDFSIPADGSFSVSVPIDQFAEPGVWAIRVNMVDQLDNGVTLSTADLQALGFPTTFEVISPNNF
jgi:hypothetical protein